MTTTMQAAFEKAGWSKAEMEVYPAALKFIKAGGSLKSWIKIYNNVAAKNSGKGRLSFGDQAADADARSASGQFSRETQDQHAARVPIPYAGKEKPKPRTRRQKDIALKTASAVARKLTFLDARKVAGKPIGDYYFRELRAVARSAAADATVGIRLGTARAVEALACMMIVEHTRPASDDQRVREILKPAEAEKIFNVDAPSFAKRWADEAIQREARELLMLPLDAA